MNVPQKATMDSQYIVLCSIEALRLATIIFTVTAINPNIHTPTVPTGKSIFAIPHTRTVNIATASQIAFNKYTKNCFTENKRCSIPCL